MPHTAPPRLYGITDSKILKGNLLSKNITAALEGGTNWIQYRDKSDNLQKRFFEASTLKVLCNKYQAKLIINDDISLAKEIAADGVHLGQADATLHVARETLGSEAIIGVTCQNSLDLARNAVSEGANYLAFGAFYPSLTKTTATVHAPLSILSEAKASFPLPVIAIGGINLQNAARVFASGADCIAVCNGLFNCDDVKSRAQQFISQTKAHN